MTGQHPILASFVALAVAGCAPETPDPDATFEVVVTGSETDCTTDTKGFQETYTYNLFFDGSAVEIHIGDDFFASGTLSGCSIKYESPVYVEERAEGASLRWQIVGDVDANLSGGGCEIGDDTGSGGDFDWLGTETLRVVESDDDTVPVGCTYLFRVAGTLQGG